MNINALTRTLKTNSPNIPTIPSRHRRSCAHCGAQGEAKDTANEENFFCCNGCRVVYTLIHSRGLDLYYDLRKTNSESPSKPAVVTSEGYQYLDDPVFFKKLAPDALPRVDFYLEGIHCAACLWLVEKLPTFVPGVTRATLDIGKSVVAVSYEPGTRLSLIAATFNQLGYRPHPITRDEEGEKLLRKENRTWLIRIGIAGACTGNIMLLTVPLYAGLGESLATWFRCLSLGLFLPVATYCATPFYKSALTALRSRTISIDVPVVLAIVFGSATSLLHVLTGEGHIYFDSLAALVFLLLSSRHALRRIQQTTLQTSQLFQFLSPSAARRLEPTTHAVTEVAVSSLKEGDLIEVSADEVIAADGVVRSGLSQVNCALLTGESTPLPVSIGSEIFAGTVNMGAKLLIEVTRTGEASRLGAILKKIQDGTLAKPQIVGAADRVAKWFLSVVILASIAVLFAAPTLTEGFSRALALIIVTCPCALALATPLAMRVSLGRAARLGILVKSGEALERISRIKNVVLDKTGTLTYGNFEVLRWNDSSDAPNLKAVICALEGKSKHPIARALVHYLRPQLGSPLPEVFNYEQQVGCGISGTVDAKNYVIQPLRSAASTAISFLCNGTLIGDAQLGDRLREDSVDAIRQLKRLGLRPYLLSGDNIGSVQNTARQLEVPTSDAVAEATPELKRKFLEDHPFSLMVGDGANDALALSSAYASAAVRGSMEVSLRAADVYLTNEGVAPVLQLIGIARAAMRTIHRNFAFSLLYNLVGGAAAATGHVDPLFAAILMPASAFTVFASSLWGNKVRTS